MLPIQQELFIFKKSVSQLHSAVYRNLNMCWKLREMNEELEAIKRDLLLQQRVRSFILIIM